MANELKDISSVPTFHFYKDGSIVDKFTGGNPSKLKEGVEKLVKTSSAASLTNASATDDAAKKTKKEEKKESNDDAKQAVKEASESTQSNKDVNEISGKVINVATLDDYNRYIAKGRCVVDFSAEWCGPCRQ
jgi:thioredoxin-like negative regulator of GroEL